MSDNDTRTEIHCWGDSLTEGYTYFESKLDFKPYTDHLLPLLVDKHGKKSEFSPETTQVKNFGVSGETTKQILMRFEDYFCSPTKIKEEQLRQKQEKSTKFFFVFLAGTNDLGTRKKGYFENMKHMIQFGLSVASASGGGVVVCSVPAMKLEGSFIKTEKIYPDRKKFNSDLKQLVDEEQKKKELEDQKSREEKEEEEEEEGKTKQQQSNNNNNNNKKKNNKKHILFYDWFEESGQRVPFGDTEEERSKNEQDGNFFVKMRPDIAADNLHFTADGYKLLAEGVAATLAQF